VVIAPSPDPELVDPADLPTAGTALDTALDTGLDTALDTGLVRVVDSAADPDRVSAEVVALLARATVVRGGRDLRVATRAAAGLLERSLTGPGPLVPGLGGASGAVWALVEAARAVEDKALGWRALAAAAAIPVHSADPGLAAGAGLAQLRLWTVYRDPRARARVRECADALVRSGAPAHDPAGTGAFLLAAGRATGSRAALRAADVAAAALRSGGTATRSDTAAAASFLVRHGAATGDRRSGARAEALAVAAAPDPTAGHLLLDLAAFGHGNHDGLDRGGHLARAAHLAVRLPRPADPAALSFLLRLRHGGPRPWFAGDLETAAPALRPAG
jgi:hypothetical protein